jgi:hypothetical protein
LAWLSGLLGAKKEQAKEAMSEKKAEWPRWREWVWVNGVKPDLDILSY